MLVYFVAEDKRTIVTLDSETGITISSPASVSSNSVMSGKTTSDTLIVGNETISVEGVVTYSKTVRQANNPTPTGIQDLLRQAQLSEQRFTLYQSAEINPLMKPKKDCVVSDFSVKISEWEDTVTVTIQFTQVFISDSATVTILPQRSKANEVDLADVDQTTTQGKDKKSEEDSRSIWKAFQEEGFDLAGEASDFITGG